MDGLSECVVNFEHGTIVTIEGIFHQNNVRKYDLSKNSKFYQSKIIGLINHYAFIYFNIEFKLSFEFSDAKQNHFYHKPIFQNQIENLRFVLGPSISQALHYFNENLEDFHFSGYIMNIFQDGVVNESNQVYMSINRRPIHSISSIVSIVKTKIERFDLRKKFFLMLEMELPYDQVEVNYEKSKMHVKLQQETKILEFLKSILNPIIDEFYSSIKVLDPPKSSQKIEFNYLKPDTKKRFSENLSSNSILAEEIKNLDQQLVRKIETIPLPSETNESNLSGKFIKLKNFEKADFAKLNIVGQFNKGFIICKQKDKDNRLYVVDQHASDEKSSFECLINNLSLGVQKLAIPIKLKLSLFEIHLISRNIQLFEKWKFNLKVNLENNSVEILSCPQFRSLTFGEKEFHELINQVKDNNENVADFLFSQLKNELASIACRSSIMIGEKLNTSQMSSIVDNMKELKAPFNCPHGRPTMFQVNLTTDLVASDRKISEYLFEE